MFEQFKQFLNFCSQIECKLFELTLVACLAIALSV